MKILEKIANSFAISTPEPIVIAASSPPPVPSVLPKITLVINQDWEGIYIGGKLAAQDCQLSLTEVLRKLGYEVEEIKADEDTLFYLGTLPEKVEDVPLHIY